MKPDTLFEKILWGLTPVNLSFGPVFVMIGIKSSDTRSTSLYVGTMMLVLGLMAVRIKINQFLNDSISNNNPDCRVPLLKCD